MTQSPQTDATDPLKDAASVLLARFGDLLSERIQVFEELIEHGVLEDEALPIDAEFRRELPADLDTVRTLVGKIAGGNADFLNGDEKTFLTLEPSKPGEPLEEQELQRDVLGELEDKCIREMEWETRPRSRPTFLADDEVEAIEMAEHNAEQATALHEEYRQLAILYQRERGQSIAR